MLPEELKDSVYEPVLILCGGLIATLVVCAIALAILI